MGWPYKSDGNSPLVYDTDPAGWSFSTWWLYVFAAYYLVNFLWFWFCFRRAERAAKSGGGPAIAQYNRLLRGFPNAVFAKMFGRRPLELANAPDGPRN